MPVPIAAGILFLLPRYLDRDEAASGFSLRKLDFGGTATLAATMLGLVYTVVEAPSVGWGSPRTLLSFVGVAALLSAFVLIEQHSPNPLVRLGILRSPQLRRANFGAMALLGSWFGFQFMGTLYMQDLRDWSAVEMALAFLPTGIIVATASPNIGRIVNRVGTTVPIAIGLTSLAASYVLFLNIGANTDYLTGMLPTFILAGIGFALTFGPLNMAATGGVAPEEQGLASGLVYTSFQVGGAIGLAIATAVIDAGTAASSAPAGSAAALLDGFHPAILTSLAIAVIGIGITVVPLLRERTSRSWRTPRPASRTSSHQGRFPGAGRPEATCGGRLWPRSDGEAGLVARRRRLRQRAHVLDRRAGEGPDHGHVERAVAGETGLDDALVLARDAHGALRGPLAVEVVPVPWCMSR